MSDRRGTQVSPSTSVELIATPSQTVGPFLHVALGTDPAHGRVVAHTATGERLRLRVTVTDADRLPVPDALVELWQVDSQGSAATASQGTGSSSFVGFGRLPTDEQGSCEFDTVRPGRVPDGKGGLQASHINMCLFARGLLRHLHTRVYFAGDDALGEDAVLALVPEARRHTLLAHPDREVAGRWVFDVRLQGDEETVFFDL